MSSEIKTFALAIREKTNIPFSVYSEDGSFIFGEEENKIPVLDKEKIIDDGNSIFFPIKFKNNDYIGEIKGTGEKERNYALLISALASSELFKDVGLSREEFCSSVLFGEANVNQIDRYMKKYGIKNSPVFVMVITTSKEYVLDVVKMLSNFTSETIDFVTEIDERRVAFVKFIGEERNDYHSTIEYAEFIQQSIFEEIGAPIHVAIGGTVNNFADLNVSYSQAMSCAKTSEDMGSNGLVHSFKEFILVKMLEDLPKNKLIEYLELLMDVEDKEIFSDKEMTVTAEEFLDNSLNVSETARKLYLHRNTLIYRLDKIEKETGLNIRKFSDAITFRLITILLKTLR